ncbi:hypothetical protein BpHYR1_030757 [Brachionus plicatilis]|uniref:Uncharacterized protein n=1 Tax=Brachionus plicatilis TaxID=10195 RepID=A0A3M7PIW3_BRAPC|nr:hypothetical protein BpHYR1_030757 [Brachionus plicatilis]
MAKALIVEPEIWAQIMISCDLEICSHKFNILEEAYDYFKKLMHRKQIKTTHTHLTHYLPHFS